MMQDFDRAETLNVHGLLVRRVRRIAVFVALLFLLAVNLHFERLNDVRREYAVREAYFLSLPTDSPLLKDTPIGPFNSKDMPRLRRAIEIQIQMDRGTSPHAAFGLQLPFETYVALLLFGSTAALATLWLTMRQLRKLHTALATEATDGGALQRTLNSPFFERVTLQYGEPLAPASSLSGYCRLSCLRSRPPWWCCRLVSQFWIPRSILYLMAGSRARWILTGSRLFSTPARAQGSSPLGIGIMVIDIFLALAVLASGAGLTKGVRQHELKQ